MKVFVVFNEKINIYLLVAMDCYESYLEINYEKNCEFFHCKTP